MKNIKRLLAEQVRALRIESGLSQHELAERAALNHNYVGRLERGEINCTIMALANIAAVLGVTVTELITLPGADTDVARLRKSVIKEIEESPPEVVRLVSDLLKDLKTLSTKPGSKRQKR
jgi:transcriptional regulator with XRE-family HTH domain